MIVLQLLYLGIFVVFIITICAWVCLKNRTPSKTAQQPKDKQAAKNSNRHNLRKGEGNRNSPRSPKKIDKQEFNRFSKAPEENSVKDSKLVLLGEEKRPQEHVSHQSQKPQMPQNTQKDFVPQSPSHVRPSDMPQIAQMNSLAQAHSELISQKEASQSQQIKIRKASRRQRQKQRLQTVKNHYKKIIAQLQTKLESVCSRNNESMSVMNPNQTVLFSEEDSLATYQDEEFKNLEVKVQEIEYLQQQLQFHEEMVTNLLEEDMELKAQLNQLKEENQKLRSSAIYSGHHEEKNYEQMAEIQQKQEENAQHSSFIVKQEQHMPLQEQKNRLSSPIKRLYASQFLFPTKDQVTSSLSPSRTSQPPLAMSTISMMSIIEGAINIGLLGQCRFLNEISKNFTVNEVKKRTKRRIHDSELVFTSKECKEEQHVKVLESVVSRLNTFLVLIKFTTGKSIGIFSEKPVLFSEDVQDEGKFILMDISKRKTIVDCQTSCYYSQRGLTWGNQEIVISDSTPLTISNKGLGKIFESKEKIQALFDQPNGNLLVQCFQIFLLYLSEQ